MSPVPQEVPFPDELRILNPEEQKAVVAIGIKAYELYPMTEGQAECLSLVLTEIFSEIYTLDMECMVCHHIHEGVYGSLTTCTIPASGYDGKVQKGRGAMCGGRLRSLQKPMTEALLSHDRIARILSDIIGLDITFIKEHATIPQMKHLVGVLWKQNFSDEILPAETQENFHHMVGWLGLMGGVSDNGQSQSAVSTNPSPASMDTPESISKDAGPAM
jgi:hypothetical protein